MNSLHRPEWSSKFRQQLQDRIRSIQHRGWPVAGAPETFGIECVMDLDQMGTIQRLVGECNDAPFCWAEPACLTVVGQVRHGQDAQGRHSVTVQFAYAASPRRTSAPFDPTSPRFGPTGQRAPLQSGADFAANLP
jgi:hypothetical protein